FDARKWADLQARLAGLKARWEKAQALIAESDAIEQAYARLRELKEVIPHILVIQEKQLAIAESERNTSQLTALKDQSDARRAENEQAADVVRKKRASHQKSLMQEEQRLKDVERQLRELAGQLGQVRLFEEQTVQLRAVEQDLARLPKGPEAAVRQAQEAFDHAVEVGKAVPLIDRFAAARLQLREATTRRETLGKAEQATGEAGKGAKERHAGLKAKFEAAMQSRQRADEAATEARTLLQQAKSAADEFGKLQGAKVCRACGQELTPGHWEEEKAKREKERKAAADRHKKAMATQAAAVAAESAARGEFEAADKELTRLRDEYRDTKKEWEIAEKDVDRLTDECRHGYTAVPDAYRQRIAEAAPADWLATPWPTADDLRELKKESGSLDVARARLREAREQLTRFDRLQAEKKAAEAMLAKVRAALPPGDPARLREQEANLKAEEETFTLKTRGTKSQLQETELEAERLNKELADVQK